IGTTSSTDFPVTPGAFQTTNAGLSDAFVAKLSPSGSSLLFSTYLGGNWIEDGLAIAIDPAHNVYVTGASVESSFPTVNPMPNSGGGWTFITKFHPDGKSVYFSYRFGGSGGVAGSTGTIAQGIAVDANSHIYIAGSAGEGLPVTPGAYQSSLA